MCSQLFRIYTGVALVCVLLFGCTQQQQVSEDRAPAKGSVTLDGQPLTGGGTVKFQSVDNPRIRVSCSLNDKGEFLIADAPKGKVKMTVVTDPKTFPDQTRIPKRYQSLRTSNLEGTIAVGDESFEIKLTKRP